MTNPILQTRDITGGYDNGDILHGVSLDLQEGEFLGIVGPNGSGKSTLLKALSGLLPHVRGKVTVGGRAIDEYSPREHAQWIGLVPQITVPMFAFSVRDVVEMGRHPHIGRFASPIESDGQAVDEAMRLTDIEHLRDRPVDQLSSGEYQRVTIARALAQQPRILFLDEPTAHLDLGHQMDIFSLLVRLSSERGLAVICVSHDLNLAAEYCKRLALFSMGSIFAIGDPAEVITEENLKSVYGTLVCVRANPYSGQPMVLINRTEETGGEL
jgi:iron complex transport system ATP-binding protein